MNSCVVSVQNWQSCDVMGAIKARGRQVGGQSRDCFLHLLLLFIGLR